jgi:hypothetical protein
MKFALDRERWALIAPYLEQALDLPPQEREGLLARLAREQPLIAATLGELLADRCDPSRPPWRKPRVPVISSRSCLHA